MEKSITIMSIKAIRAENHCTLSSLLTFLLLLLPLE